MIRSRVLVWLVCTGAISCATRNLSHGVIAGSDLQAIPIPDARYQVYLIGEFHGTQEIKSVFLGFLDRLHRDAGLRDVFLEEDAVYQSAARDYVGLKTNEVPAELCLRADVLGMVRRFNSALPVDQRVRVHLVDIDSPLEAIRRHLIDVKDRIGADAVKIPDDPSWPDSGGLEVVEEMTALAAAAGVKAELETIKNSIVAYREGLRIGTTLSDTKGNPLIDAREGAITRNVLNVVRSSPRSVVLGLYGGGHVRKKPYSFPREANGHVFTHRSLALRLVEAGTTVLSVLCWPVSGRVSWRGNTADIPNLAANHHLTENQSLEQLFARVPTAKFVCLDLVRQPDFLFYGNEKPSGTYDFLVFIRDVTPMKGGCDPSQP